MDKDIQTIAQKCSKSHELDTAELHRLIPYVESFLDRDWLNAQLAKYKVWALGNSEPFLQYNFLHRPIGFNMLVTAIWAARYWKNESINDSSFQLKMGARRLLNIASSLAVLEYNAEKWLNTTSRSYLKKRLTMASHLWGVIHELNTFAFFIRQGATVEPHFLNRASSQDITVNWSGISVPVECKNLRPGTGRSISQEIFINLASHIALDMRKSNKSLMVKIGTTGKISKEDARFLRAQVKGLLKPSVGAILVSNNDRTYSIRTQRLLNQPTDIFLETSLASSLYLKMVISEPEKENGICKPVAAVGIESNPVEKPLNSLKSAIMKGVRQLKGNTQGILAIYYSDPVEDFNDFCPDSITMQGFISQLLTPYQQVGAVILSSEPDYLGLSTSKAGKTYIYYRKPWAFPEDFLRESQ